jgi:tetratricopeptide (TPR) repeat protein
VVFDGLGLKMDAGLGREILEYQDYLGFSLSRAHIPLEANQAHNECFSLGVCHRFYGREEELEEAIAKGNRILKRLISEHKKEDRYETYLELFYAILGNMYYVKGDFRLATGYFMKVLDYAKDDITAWVELLFSLRAMGEFELFEEGIFAIERIYKGWKKNRDDGLTQNKLILLING